MHTTVKSLYACTALAGQCRRETDEASANKHRMFRRVSHNRIVRVSNCQCQRRSVAANVSLLVLTLDSSKQCTTT